jgi:hypothetical protein
VKYFLTKVDDIRTQKFGEGPMLGIERKNDDCTPKQVAELWAEAERRDRQVDELERYE